ncbi:hypothetical protein MKHDV_00505 [Halodesulfovibrio sp. MK-HDV]|nr:hypothetical protein MKHDV_00505 [Halodesulfovibrio sp. MK-HDV]
MEVIVKYVIYASFAANIICATWVAINVVGWVKSLNKKD